MRVRDDLLAVVGFYSRLPVPPAAHGRPLAEAAWIVPVAGAVIAAPAAALMGSLAALGLSPLAAATVGVGALIVTTGALHEDGLADCADGFWGGAATERRLEIMRDSRLGTYGVLALILAVLLRVALFAAALGAGTLSGMAALVAAAAAGRAVALYPWVGLPAARTGGLAVAVGRPTSAAFRRALLLAIVVTGLLGGPVTALGTLAGAVAAVAAAWAVAAVADAKIGGHTGDVIGAAVVAAETAWLAAFVLFL